MLVSIRFAATFKGGRKELCTLSCYTSHTIRCPVEYFCINYPFMYGKRPEVYALYTSDDISRSKKSGRIAHKTNPPDRNRAGDLEIGSELYSLTLYQLSYRWVDINRNHHSLYDYVI